jgi:cytidylate kinase
VAHETPLQAAGQCLNSRKASAINDYLCCTREKAALILNVLFLEQMKIIIAIDGYSSCGKSTLARQLARQLQYTYLDSGAMYRAITLYFIRENIPLNDEEAVRKGLPNIKLRVEAMEDATMGDMFLNDENVSRYIREMTVADKVSEVSALKDVREFAVAQQQEMGKKKGVVMDGRDIGTVVFPDAELKIFMDADIEVRVKRRFLELQAANTNVNLNIEDVKTNLEMRDYIDANRKESPLRQARDARVLDSSDLKPEEQLQIALGWAKEAIAIAEAEA